MACKTTHIVGSCPLKTAGVEYCNLCGIAHYGQMRVCPHITSETQVSMIAIPFSPHTIATKEKKTKPNLPIPQVRAMLEALKASNEPEHLVQAAIRYLKGLKGNLVQLKKQKQLKEHAARESAANTNFQQYQYEQPQLYQQQQHHPQQQPHHYQQPQMGYGGNMPPPVFRKPGGGKPPPSSGPGFYTTSG